MSNESKLAHYRSLLESLSSIITQAEDRLVQAEDQFFVQHANFLVKSFLICMCSYLESYLKESANDHIDHWKGKIALARVPHNIIQWQINSSAKETDWKFSDYSISLNRDDIDQLLSANPHKTIVTFKHIGVDLRANESFTNRKNIVGAVIEKRNNIVHHNDSATDITLGDIQNYIATFIDYIEAIDASIMEHRL